MARNNTLFLVITGSVTGQLEDLSSKVLENGSKVNYGECVLVGCASLRALLHTWSTSAYTLSVVSAFQETVDTTDRELEASLCRARLALRLATGLARGRFATDIRISSIKALEGLILKEMHTLFPFQTKIDQKLVQVLNAN